MTSIRNSIVDEKTEGWVTDGSEGTLAMNDDGSFTMTSAPHSGSPFNARLEVPLNRLSTQSFFEIQIISKSSSISVGLVRPSDFGPGYKCKGMFYNGNLTNGSAALRVGFGPYLKEGDTVGVLVETTDLGETTVTFFVNGDSLGAGFSYPGSTEEELIPCLHVKGTAQLKYRAPINIPSKEQETVIPSGPEGDWKLEELSDGDSPISIPSDPLITLHVEKDGADYNMNIRVVNTMRGHMTLSPAKIGNLISTMMMGPPELMKIEALLSENIPKVDDITAMDTALSFFLPGDSLLCRWTRYEKPVQGPITVS